MKPEQLSQAGYPSSAETGPFSEESTDLAEIADQYVFFLGNLDKQGWKFGSEGSESKKKECDFFDNWLVSLNEAGLKVEISLNPSARDWLKTQAYVMDASRIGEWYAGGIGYILRRTHSPLRIRERATGDIVHQAVYEEVEIQRTVLPSVQQPRGN